MIAVTEAMSFLVLLFIAMPLKYFSGIPEAVTGVGWLHGLLFVLYVYALFEVKAVEKWSFKKFFLAGVASLLPFGPFVFEKRILNTIQ